MLFNGIELCKNNFRHHHQQQHHNANNDFHARLNDTINLIIKCSGFHLIVYAKLTTINLQSSLPRKLMAYCHRTLCFYVNWPCSDIKLINEKYNLTNQSQEWLFNVDFEDSFASPCTTSFSFISQLYSQLARKCQQCAIRKPQRLSHCVNQQQLFQWSKIKSW